MSSTYVTSAFFEDRDFLKELDTFRVREQLAKIILLDFAENPLEEIQGRITAGSLSVNGSSSVRRTISLTMLSSIVNSDITNLDNEISINKKIRVFVGYKNPLRKYEDILWFPCGTFVISSASVSRSTSGWNIQIQGKDKMVMLNGSVGGTLFASTTFHEKYIDLGDGNYKIEKPTIVQIIREAVNHFGHEPLERIFINDLDETAKQLMKYAGSKPVYFNKEYTSFSFTKNNVYTEEYKFNDDIGYQLVDFIYPGELILAAGDNVCTLLDKIVQTLGNFEYFYDINGNFIFQQKRNYLNIGSDFDNLSPESYLKNYSNTKPAYSLTDLSNVSSISVSPKYDNIKNDFVVWGKRTDPNGGEHKIRYHLAIDEKPILNLCKQYMYSYLDKKGNTQYKTFPQAQTIEGYTLVGGPCDEWREELYRQALFNQADGISNTSYDIELLAEWRKLYNPITGGWNADVRDNPSKLDYWLDFIDASSALGQYSIEQIGRRTKVSNNDKLTSIYNKEVPDLVFISPSDTVEENQKTFQLTEQYKDLFVASSTGASCLDEIRELLYQYLVYNTQISISCLPKYYLEPNNILYIEDKETGVIGNYSIESFTLPLTYNGTMQITATEVLTRV